MQASLRKRNHAARWSRFLSRLFGGKAVNETITTRAHFNASPEAVWKHIMFYEEVPENPPFLLRTFLPRPIRTEGNKVWVGATVRCTYREGVLVKRVTRVEPPHMLQFEVIKQNLGVEGCTLTTGGSYEIYTDAYATEVQLTTNYRAYLQPRFLWRRLEKLLVLELHNHILNGLRIAISLTNRDILVVVREPLTPQAIHSGGLACSTSKSPSRRY